jgi:hypothetical protein
LLYAVTNDLSLFVTHDADSLPRALDSNGDGVARFDLGAYEVLLPTADSNGDGIPDGWTLRYGFNPTEPGVGSGNPDGDPHTTYEEWVADTDPTNAASCLRVTGVSDGPPLSVQFLSSTNRQYTLFRTADVTGGGWTGVPGQTNLPGAGGPMTLSDTNAVPQSFYKVGVRVP